MVDGTYNVTARTIFGPVKAVVTLTTDGDVCTASINVGGEVQKAVGNARGNQLSFAGTAKTPMGNLAYHVSGSIDGDALRATALAKVGKVRISGTRV